MDYQRISKEDLIQNLKDAYCDEELIKDFLRYYQENDFMSEMKLLKCHRCTLIEKMHKDQKKIDCLDYLIFQLKKMI